MKNTNLCLIFHCLKDDNSLDNDIHSEMFVHRKEVEELIIQLKKEGYVFKLPQDAKKGEKVCTFTLDDGYANNKIFLDIAKKYEIPFILFLSSYNIISQRPYLWDTFTKTEGHMYHISKFDYIKYYNEVVTDPSLGDNYRPFIEKELHSFNDNSYAKIALHSHYHQPYVGNFLEKCEEDLNTNREYVSRFSNTLLEDFALPCGLYTKRTISILKKKCQRIYTTDGAGYKAGSRVISRISLVNPKVGGPLMDQIKSSFKLKNKLRRFVAIKKYSHPNLL